MTKTQLDNERTAREIAASVGCTVEELDNLILSGMAPSIAKLGENRLGFRIRLPNSGPMFSGPIQSS
jgi:hypothetical protein